MEAQLEEPDELIVEEIVAGSVNTVALTNTGKVYVLGDNTYHQHAVEELLEPDEKRAFGRFCMPTEIVFPQPDVKISIVACGAYHVIVKSSLDEIYGWGRSDEGQLGIGYLCEKITQPEQIKDLSYQGIKQICCEDNYSAALTYNGNIFVAGALDGGRLGLGKGQKRGF